MNKSKIHLFTIFIAFAISLSIVNIAIDKLVFGNTAEKIALNNGVKKAQEREDFVKKFLFQSEQTLKSIRELESFDKYLSSYDEQKSLENIFLSYAMSQTSFMQLRYIDKDGFEKIRVDRDKERLQPYIIPYNKLQNKSNRYYFFDSKIKPLGEVWFSALDLNIERGKVEIPYRSTLRAMLPISKNGKFEGILIINYFMDQFLKDLTYTPLYDMILFDDKGFPLYHYDNTKSWGFYKRPQHNIASDFPNDYKQILQKNLLKTDQYVTRKIDVPIHGGLHLSLQLKHSYIEQQNKQSNYRNITVTFFTFLISFILTLMIVKLFSEKLLNIKKLKKLNKDLEISEEKLQKDARELEETYDELESSYNNISIISEKYELEKYKYKSILDFASDGIFIMNMDGKLIEYSNEAFNLLGYSKEEMEKLSIYDWNVEHTKEEINDLLQHITNDPVNIETTHRRKDGSTYIASVMATKITVNEVDYIYASVRDITQQKENEKKILEQKIEFETIFNTSKDGIAILDDKSNFVNFNRAYLEMTGFSREELLTKSCVGLSSPESKQSSIEMLSKIFEIGYIENYQKTCIGKNDKKIVTNMSIALLPDRKRILISTKDITSLKLMEEQSKLASMGEMIGNIAHQWRQPLSVITTSATGMKMQKEYGVLKDETFNKTCDAINDNAQYLSKTIDDFRNFIKGDSILSMVKISKIIKETLNLLDASLSNNYIKLELSIEEDLEINANKNELEQAFINIINNAKDALVEKVQEKERIIFISTTNIDDTSLELKICDNGGGIPSNVIGRIFEPYFTTKHQNQGTGLGLAMTHKILTKKYKQKMSVNNEEFEYKGKNYIGACFKILFNNK